MPITGPDSAVVDMGQPCVATAADIVKMPSTPHWKAIANYDEVYEELRVNGTIFFDQLDKRPSA